MTELDKMELRIKCECIITCDNTLKEFKRRLENISPDDALAFLRRAHRSVILSRLPEIEEWYAGIKSQEK